MLFVMAFVYCFVFFCVFVIGIFFGSFSTLAVYRIPRKIDITHERSFCPNCGHRLGFLDLFPLLSFLVLGGKCRYCKEKISIRYFLIELLFGIISILFFAIILYFRSLLDYWSLVIFIGCMSLFEVLFLVVWIKFVGAHCNVPEEK